MARVQKAVVTAAGMGTRHFPATQTLQKEMMPLVDRDGTTKPTIQIILEEALESGIEEFCVVLSPSTADQFRRHFQGLSAGEESFFRGKSWALEQSERLRDLGRRITYVVQEQQNGYGDAVYRAREFVGDHPFLLLLGDHVFIPGGKKPCSRQAIDVYNAYQAPVTGVQRTHEDLLHLFGTLTGTRIASDPNVYEVSRIEEKPTLELAEEHLRTEGLGRGEYLCFFGVSVFPPLLFELLEYHIRHDIRERGEIQLTNALEMLRAQGRYLAAEIDGQRCDMGVPMGYIETQLALALHSGARKRVLASLPNLLALNDPDPAH
ncbi:MAG: UTP--glucose-1-phosphate uridylyltransferase [Armatimonadota bacterium]